jgi:phenylalanyl-tRNA synthetase beta chain
VFLLDLDVASLEKHLPGQRTFRGIPRFPAVKRDLSLLVPRHVAYEDVQRVVDGAGGKLLESVQCFDVFEDSALGEGARSVGLRLRFRSAERTLLDDLVEPVMQNIVRRLQSELGVRLRIA